MVAEPEGGAAPRGAQNEVLRLRRELRERNEQLRQIVDLVPFIVFAKDWDGRFLLANRALADAYGVSVSEILDTWHGDLHEEHGELSRMLAEDRAVMRSGRRKEIPERVFRDSRGRERVLQTTKIPFVTAQDGKPAVLGVSIDVTDRKRAEERFQLAIDAAPCGMLMTNVEGTIVIANREIEKIFGYEKADLIGRPAMVLVPDRLREQHLELRARFLEGEKERELVRGRALYGRRADGTEIPVELGMNAVRSSQGMFILTSVVDVTDQRQAEDQIRGLNAEMEQRVIERTAELATANERLRQEIAERERIEQTLKETARSLEQANSMLKELALHDGLTGLPNRRSFDERLDLELMRTARSGRPLSLIIVDADHFKAYNDALGHLAGDEALRVIGRAIQGCLRRPGDLAARYGGEEFGMLLPETDGAGAMLVGELVRQAVRDAGLQPGAHPVTVSLGVATTTAETTAEELIAAADGALYRAKAGGRDRVVRADGPGE